MPLNHPLTSFLRLSTSMEMVSSATKISKDTWNKSKSKPPRKRSKLWWRMSLTPTKLGTLTFNNSARTSDLTWAARSRWRRKKAHYRIRVQTRKRRSKTALEPSLWKWRLTGSEKVFCQMQMQVSIISLLTLNRVDSSDTLRLKACSQRHFRELLVIRLNARLYLREGATTRSPWCPHSAGKSRIPRWRQG